MNNKTLPWKIGLTSCPMPDAGSSFAQIDHTEIFTPDKPICLTVNEMETAPEDVWERLLDNVMDYQENCNEAKPSCVTLYSRDDAEDLLNSLAGENNRDDVSLVEKISLLWDNEKAVKYFG